MQGSATTPPDYGWPQPRAGDRWERRTRPTPPRRRGPALLDLLWIALGLLGIAIAAAALTWYVGLRSAPAQPPVANVIGLAERPAAQLLNRDGYVVRALEVPSRTGVVGVVFAQAPVPGTSLRRGATVTIRVARRP